jgi:hypothetical protein
MTPGGQAQVYNILMKFAVLRAARAASGGICAARERCRSMRRPRGMLVRTAGVRALGG